MADERSAVQWTGQQALVTLPQHIDSSNVNQVREQLLWIINRGAVVLIADLSGTVSCDYSGADALARAQHRAVASGTELRLVVSADAVRRVLSTIGLDRLVAVYPDLDGAVAAGAEARELEPTMRPEDQAARAEELLDLAINSIFNVGLILQTAIDLPPYAAAQRITEALRCLDDAVGEVRAHAFAGRPHGVEPGPAGGPSRHLLEQSARAIDRSGLLQRHVAQTAHMLQSVAADTAALLERRVALLGQPGHIDYPTDVKRWRAIADQAAQMAERWEQ